jgi:hypothetical protein
MLSPFRSPSHDDDLMMLPMLQQTNADPLSRALRERNEKIQRSF